VILALLLQVAAPMPPSDWSALPLFPLPRGAQVVDVAAVLIGEQGALARIVPRAIGCATIEQYTVGYVQSLVRGGPGAVVPAPGWYRLAVTYRW
jgi:hypothetical protein